MTLIIFRTLYFILTKRAGGVAGYKNKSADHNLNICIHIKRTALGVGNKPAPAPSLPTPLVLAAAGAATLITVSSVGMSST